MKNFIVIVLLLLAFSSAQSQDKKAKKFAASITIEDLEARLSVLASDSLEGRETGRPGQKKAAKYIQERFESFGLQPSKMENGDMSYQQAFKLYKSVNKEVSLQTGETSYTLFENMAFWGTGRSDGPTKTQAVLTSLSSDIDVKDKIAIYHVPDGNWRAGANEATDAGAIGVIFLIGGSDGHFQGMLNNMKQFMASDRLSLTAPKEEQARWFFFVSPNESQNLFGIDTDSLASVTQDSSAIKEVSPIDITVNVDRVIEEVTSENVLGYMPGTDLKDELLVITSHYDHLGKRGDVVYNGADDDGSGTTSLLEIAEAI